MSTLAHVAWVAAGLVAGEVHARLLWARARGRARLASALRWLFVALFLFFAVRAGALWAPLGWALGFTVGVALRARPPARRSP